jgi:hypothetical protein
MSAARGWATIVLCEPETIPMMNRRGFVLALTSGLVALVLVVGSVLADELLGVITKVDPDGKQITVVEKEFGKEIKVKVTDKTEEVTRKGIRKVDLDKLEKRLEKAQDGGEKGLSAKITHEKGVASKIQITMKKKSG